MSQYWLDIVTTVLGLIYIWLEYKASIALWIVGIVMPALDVWLYWTHGRMATQAWLSTTPLQQSTAMRYGNSGARRVRKKAKICLSLISGAH